MSKQMKTLLALIIVSMLTVLCAYNSVAPPGRQNTPAEALSDKCVIIEFCRRTCRQNFCFRIFFGYKPTKSSAFAVLPGAINPDLSPVTVGRVDKR